MAKAPAESVLPLPENGFGSLDFWKKELKAAEEKRDADQKPEWDRNVRSYLAKQLVQSSEQEQIVVPKDFSNTEQKKAQLFFQLPKIHCTPQRPDFQDAVPLVQAILRFYLSRHRVDAMALMNEVLFDALCPAGIMCSKIGYESTQDGTKQVTVNAPNPQAGQAAPLAPPLGGTTPAVGGGVGPMAATPGSVLGLNGPTQPQVIPVPQDVPNIISERYFWERISPAKVLIPEKFVLSNYDRAPWMGFEFLEPWEVTKRKYNLTDDDLTKLSGDDDHKIRSEKNVTTRSHVDQARGWEIYYRASLYDPKEKNTDKIRLLVILEGMDKPVRHKDSPYQRPDPTNPGKVLGMKGYPIHVGALRYVSDTSYPPSDVSISRVAVDELSKFRTQQVLLRDRSVGMVGFDPMRLGGPQTEEKIRRGILGGWVPIPGFDVKNPPAGELAKAHTNPDNTQSEQLLERDVQDVWGFSPNQLGQQANASRSATEENLVQAASNNRIAKDRERVVDYFVKGAEKLWSLIQLFADDEQFVEIIGTDGVRRLHAWDKTTVAGEYVFDAQADSAMQPDYNQDRMMHLKAYELLRRDPQWNPVPMLHNIASAFDYDPATSVIDQPPPKPPEPAKIQMSGKLEDLDPGNPNFPLWIALLRQSGYQLPDDLIAQVSMHREQQGAMMTQLAQMGITADPGMSAASPQGIPPTMSPGQSHGGAAPKAERLNKHQDRTNGRQTGREPFSQKTVGRTQ